MKKRGDDDEVDAQSNHAPGIVLDESMIKRNNFIAEADTLSRQGNYSNAILLYSKAIEMKPVEVLYLCRARCLAFIGKIDEAIKDANAALTVNPSSMKALLCKADVLFSKGDFENAMIWYSRGAHDRPEIPEFKAGMNRCKEAILHAIHELDDKHLKEMKHSMQHPSNLQKNSSSSETKLKKSTEKMDATDMKLKRSQSLNYAGAFNGNAMSSIEVTERNLLEELYPDRVFLKQCLADPIIMDSCDGQVGELIHQGMTFLDQRIEFWRNRNPLAIHELTILDDKLPVKKAPAMALSSIG